MMHARAFRESPKRSLLVRLARLLLLSVFRPFSRRDMSHWRAEAAVPLTSYLLPYRKVIPFARSKACL